MAETRKHLVEVRDELDKAIQAALGTPVRPQEPGAPAPREATEPTGAEEATASDAAKPHTTPFIAPGSTMGGFTFGGPRTTKKN